VRVGDVPSLMVVLNDVRVSDRVALELGDAVAREASARRIPPSSIAVRSICRLNQGKQ
jgi:hypothetical protein